MVTLAQSIMSLNSLPLIEILFLEQLRADITISFCKGELNNCKRFPLQVQAPVQELQAKVVVSVMCQVFVVQVCCMHVSGAGYWSDWSHWVHSTPQNSRGTLYFTIKPYKYTF